MATITKTTNYDLTQYNGVDLPTFLNDITSDNQKIDSALKTIDNKVDFASDIVEQVNTNTSDIANVTGRVETLEAEVALLQPEALDNLQRRVGICETDINANSELIEALTTRVADDEDNLRQHALRIGALETNLESTNVALTDLTNEVRTEDADIKSRLTDAETDITSLTENVSTLADAVTSLDSDVDGVHVDIQTNATNIETLSDQVSNLQDRMTVTESAVIAIGQKVTQMYTYTGTADVSDDNKVASISAVTGGVLTQATVKGLTAYSSDGIVVIPYIENDDVYIYSPTTLSTDIAVTITAW